MFWNMDWLTRGNEMKLRIVALLMIIILLIPQTAVFAADGQTPSGIPMEGIEGFIDNYVDEYVGVTSPGTAIVVVQDGQIVFSKGYGYSDLESQIPVDPSKTIFEYGSVSKLFVYTSIMRLVEAGRLDLEADIRTYLPDGFIKKLRYAEPITLLHVMNHTTGFEDYLFDVVVTSDVRESFEETLRTMQPEQVYRPGTISAYSNYAVALAAYIVQDITGQKFYEYAMHTFFIPSGMDSTSAHPLLLDKPWLAENKATGYFRDADGGFTKGDWSYIPIYPVGGINGTAEDLARFAIALMPAKGETSPLAISNDTINEMFTQSHAMGPGLTGFAHGFIEFDGSYRGVGHGGGTACFTSQMNIVPEKGFGVIVLTNAAGEMDLTQGLTKALLGKNEKATPRYEGSLPDTGDLEGTYISARRAHNGFLKLHGYLSLLQVNTIEDGIIELQIAGQSAKYKQTAPYVFEQLEASGTLFEYNLATIYFEMKDDEVLRISSDFVPLPPGHSLPWLLADGVFALASTLFFLLVPFIIVIHALVQRRRRVESSAAVRSMRRYYAGFVLLGTALLANNLILVFRMLANNFRSFSEVSLQVLLNNPIALMAIAAGVMAFVKGRSASSRKQQILFAVTAVLLIALIVILWKWQFFHLL